ncbi:MAG: signal peptidase I [Luteolibacter sp.]|jgi:signal peptidase I|nr:signal peptidase I [Luteolibacter sp.]
MFTPKWKQEALHLTKGARKFVHYKRDLLKPGQVGEIESRRTDLLDAIKAGDRAQVDEASKQIRAACEHALPHEKPVGWLEENVEVMFVAIVIALGLRAYYLQPFRIPTGSMQPTLNGIIGTPLAEKDWPSFPRRMLEKALRGRSYVKVVNDRDRHLAVTPLGRADIRDVQMMHFFSRSEVHFSDSKPLRLPAPASPCTQIGLAAAIQIAGRNNGLLPAGTIICEGTIDSGDLVLVDKFSYHFRKPKRGEVFVFDTLGIRGIHERSGDQAAGSHYIKRLCGVPGDTLSIQTPNLLVDGNIAREPGIQRVIRGEGEFNINPNGYLFADPRELNGRAKNISQYLSKPSDTLTLTAKTRPGMREYAALGDNTGNSLDSRYWGPVKEFNLVGPALFSLWPVTTGHWGFIR